MLMENLRRLKIMKENKKFGALSDGRGCERESRWSLAPPRTTAPVRFTGSEEQWGGRDSSRVPQTGGNEGDWIDVRPRRRKALRQDHLG